MSSRYRGIFLLDALIGTMMAVIVTTAVIVVAGAQQRAADRLAESRADMRSLESALIQMQAGGPPPAGVAVHNIDDAAAPPGWVWVEATAGSGPHIAVLRGLVPVHGGVK